MDEPLAVAEWSIRSALFRVTFLCGQKSDRITEVYLIKIIPTCRDFLVIKKLSTVSRRRPTFALKLSWALRGFQPEADPPWAETIQNKKTIVLATAYFCPKAIMGAEELNCRVRNGIGCGLFP